MYMGSPGGSDSKESACNAGDLGSIPGLGRSPGEGYSYQYSCLEKSKDRGARQATWGFKELDTTEGLSLSHTHTHTELFLNSCAIHLKFIQRCKSFILQLKKYMYTSWHF